MALPVTTKSVVTTALIVTSIILPLISLTSMCLRFRARRLARQRIGCDDIFVSISWINTLGLSIVVWVYTPGCGINDIKEDLVQVVQLEAQLLYVQSILIIFSLTTIKIAVLLFYKRIFSMGVFPTIANIATVAVAVWGIVYMTVRLKHRRLPCGSSD